MAKFRSSSTSAQVRFYNAAQFLLEIDRYYWRRIDLLNNRLNFTKMYLKSSPLKILQYFCTINFKSFIEFYRYHKRVLPLAQLNLESKVRIKSRV